MENHIIKKLEHSAFRKNYYQKYENIAPPFWKRIHFQDLSAKNVVEFNSIRMENVHQEGVEFHSIETALDTLSSINFDEFRFGAAQYYVHEVYSLYNTGFYLKIKADAQVDEPIYIEYTLDKKDSQLLDFVIIEAQKNSKASIIINYKTSDNSEVYKNSVLKVIAQDSATLKLSRVQNLNLQSCNHDFSDFNLSDHAKISYYNAEFGAKVNLSASIAYLNGYRSAMQTFPAYVADSDRKVDLAYSAVFRGKMTEGTINGNGAVLDQATKVFRGNIYFEKGSRGSFGREGSFDILLDKTVQSHAIPTLFCDEDDVIGEHYASVGKINENQLMYLMSRGIPESLAKKVIVESSFRPILDNIEHEETRDSLIAELNKRIS